MNFRAPSAAPQSDSDAESECLSFDVIHKFSERKKSLYVLIQFI